MELPGNIDINAVAFSHGEFVIGTFAHGILVSKYGSARRWSNTDIIFQGTPVFFAAQWDGIYESIDGGKSWNIIRSGLPDSTPFTTLETTSTGLIAGVGLRK